MENTEPSLTRRRVNPAKPGRGRRLFLFFSLSLNLGLLLFLASVFQRSAPQANPAMPLPDNATEVSGRSQKTERVAARTAKPSPWSHLESADLAVYPAN